MKWNYWKIGKNYYYECKIFHKSPMSQQIIQKYNIWAKKSLGQNFLIDEEKLSEIGDSVNIMWSNIIEVWPGYWALTERILEKMPKALHLVELDGDMVDILESRVSEKDLDVEEVDFQIFHQDVLEFHPSFNAYKVIANIPYYITSPILRHFLYDIENTPEEMLILMQKDVGDKILGKWKNKSSVLSLMIEKKCKVEEKVFVPKECFSPVPKVESSVLLFQRYNDFDDIEDEWFLEFIKKWFLAPRKKLIKNLTGAWYNVSKIEEILCLQWKDMNFRGEDGDIKFWIDLYKSLL